MKLYEYEAFPSPRRVRIFLAEKGVDIEREQVDVPAGAHRQPDFLARNPDATVPCLELDDGSHISESVAISRYFEERIPNPPLMGTGAESKAAVEMWQRRVENGLMNPVAAYYHHATDGLGEPDRYRNRDWGERNRDTAVETLRVLDARLADHDFIAGADFSIVDITALCALDFAQAVGISLPQELQHLGRWYTAVSQRDSAAA